jgi:acyl-coenzyme A synthetase/AMP-(fatty) acid ligase
VVPAPDEDRGSVVKAFIVVGPEYEPTNELAKEIQDYCKEQTAPYKYPRQIEFIEELPKTTSGKIRRVELRK